MVIPYKYATLLSSNVEQITILEPLALKTRTVLTLAHLGHRKDSETFH